MKWAYRCCRENEVFINYFFGKCDQIRRKLQIWSRLLKKIYNWKLPFLCSEHFLKATRFYGDCVINIIQIGSNLTDIECQTCCLTTLPKSHIRHRWCHPYPSELNYCHWIFLLPQFSEQFLVTRSYSFFSKSCDLNPNRDGLFVGR